MSLRRPCSTASRVVIALAAVCIASAGWLTIRLTRENRGFRASISELENRRPDPAAPVLDANQSAAVAAARAELDRELSALRAAEAKAQTLAQSLSVEGGEELQSLGRVEELAAECVQFLAAVSQLPKAGQSPALTGSAGLDVVNWSINLDTIGRLEEHPEEIAQLHAHAIRELLSLDRAAMERIRRALVTEFRLLQANGLDRPQRPIEEQGAWYARRDQALAEAAARIEALLPADQRRPHAVAQIMHLGSGMRSRALEDSHGRRDVILYFQAPGLEAIGF